MIPGLTFTKAKSESAPSLKPPKKWFNETFATVREGLKRAHPDWDDEKLDDIARKTVGNTWHNQMSRGKKKETREAEGKTYGKAPEDGMKKAGVVLPFMAKAKNGPRYTADRWANRADTNPMKGIPAILIECYDAKGKFDGYEVHTPAMIAKDMKEYNDDALWAMLHVMSFDSWDDRKKRLQYIQKLATELTSRIEKQEKSKDGSVSPEYKPTNYDIKREIAFGKNVFFVPEEIEEKEDAV